MNMLQQIPRWVLCLCCILFFVLPCYAVPTIFPQYFLSLSDIHFDPFTQCHQVPCPLIVQLSQSPVTHWKKILEKQQAPIRYYFDSNNTLLQKMFATAKKAAADKNIQFVLVIGDNIGHNYRRHYKLYARDASLAGYQAFVKKSLMFVANELNATFPNKDIYMVVGNNDSYIGNYRFRPNSAFFQDMSSIWGNLIKSANRTRMQRQFRQAGYYAVNAPGDSRIRLIILNTTLFATYTKGDRIEQNAQQQLDWLAQELQQVQQQQQRAFIIMHIPEGVDLYATLRWRLFRLKPLWRNNEIIKFDAIIKQYASLLSAILVGHLHNNWYQILTFNDVEVPISCTPSISPVFGNDPAFKIYSYRADGQLKDIMTYTFGIHQATLWTLEQKFKEMSLVRCPQCFYVAWSFQQTFAANRGWSYTHCGVQPHESYPACH